ncbi:MAG: hypothetical protein AAFQ80_00625 [Cyanobacteria bacterium J06621_8]
MFKPESLIKISLGMLLAVATFNSTAQAQSGVDDQGFQTNERSGLEGTGGLNPLDLIHRSQQLGKRSPAEFEEESSGQLDNSATDFKRLQQQRILEQLQQPDVSVEESIDAGGDN